MLVTAGALAVLAALLIAPAPLLLARARWAAAEPRAALVLWQALGLSAGLAAVGAAFAVSLRPLGDTLPEAIGAAVVGQQFGRLPAPQAVLLVVALALAGWLLGVTVRSASGTWQSRRRHRELVDLVGEPWPGDAAARVLEHPAATAYCLPGGSGTAARLVITTGALDLLSPAELEAVLAHENAHLAERHDLLILPFAAWSTALGWFPGPARARQAVARLVEMVADDRACTGCDRTVLAAALARIGSAGVPAGALGVGEPATPGANPGSGGSVLVERVWRLLEPPVRSRRARTLALAAAAALLAVPTLALVLPAL